MMAHVRNDSTGVSRLNHRVMVFPTMDKVCRKVVHRKGRADLMVAFTAQAAGRLIPDNPDHCDY